ncbi:hypothetical protein HA397_24705 [Escherichia coli]|nr:hypothetical protein [Escherichia coli]
MNIAGVKLGAEQLEQQIVALAGCEGLFAVTGVADPLRGEAVLLAVAPARVARRGRAGAETEWHQPGRRAACIGR